MDTHSRATVDLPLELSPRAEPVVYRKTQKGLIEIETRAARLPPRLRSALIIIDGKRNDLELAALMVQGAESLATLAQQGFIEALPARSHTQPRTATAGVAPAAKPLAAKTAVAASAPNAFETRRRQILRAFTDCVGPAGDGLAIKLEKAKTLDEFRAHLHHAVNMVTSLRGRGQGEAFAASLDDF